MGMFDYICCELPLPIHGDKLFQTKDTQEWCEMKQFTIRADGRLIKQEYDLEMTPKAERPHPDAPEDSLESLCGCMRVHAGSERDVDQNFDGDLVFYADVFWMNEPDGDVEYRATFRDGNCVEICRFDSGKWVNVWRELLRGTKVRPR